MIKPPRILYDFDYEDDEAPCPWCETRLPVSTDYFASAGFQCPTCKKGVVYWRDPDETEGLKGIITDADKAYEAALANRDPATGRPMI